MQVQTHKMTDITIIGAGLAGCEAAYQLSRRGFTVSLHEMRPAMMTPAHKTGFLAEIVCSNSLGSENKNERITAAGILKEELSLLDSLILSCAESSRVPAGGALAVDRDKFASLVTERISHDPHITLIRGEYADIQVLNDRFAEIHRNYYTYEWTWAIGKIEKFLDKKIADITIADIISLVEQWKESVIALDNMLYEDAKKEFNLTTKTGFGADGDETQKQKDFDNVRGQFEQNPFVVEVQKHIIAKEALGNELIDRIKNINC